MKSTTGTARWMAALRALAVGVLGMVGVACQDDARIAELERQLAAAEAVAREKADEAQLAIEALESARDQFAQRLEQVEVQSRTALDQSGSLIADHNTRFERLEEGFAALVRRRDNLESMAYLPVGIASHATLGTAHGTFLVRIDDVLPSGESGIYNATLNIGNPLGLTINEFTLTGHFGELAPERPSGESDEDFFRRKDAWERSLTPFQHLFVEDLAPGEWTRVTLPIRADRLDHIRMLRFVMSVDRAFLANQSGSGELAFLSATREGTAVARTPYGAFLMTTNGADVEGDQIRLKLAIANPFLLTVQKARMRGEFGPTPPERQPGEGLPVYARRLEDWQAGLREFDVVIETTIPPGRWTDASVLLPASEVSELGYIRFTFNPEAAFLPVPPGTTGPR